MVNLLFQKVLSPSAGLMASAANVTFARTQAGEIAHALTSRASAGDVVVYCPDQLGPDVSRLVPRGLRQLTFPNMADPGQVDWINYRAAIAGTPTKSFAARVAMAAPPDARIWLVWSSGYRGVDGPCGRLMSALEATRPGEMMVVASSSHYYEPESLLEFSAVSTPTFARFQ